ncbi:hypothetical protein ACEQUB_01332 [Ralstonia syzygii]
MVHTPQPERQRRLHDLAGGVHNRGQPITCSLNLALHKQRESQVVQDGNVIHAH